MPLTPEWRYACRVRCRLTAGVPARLGGGRRRRTHRDGAPLRRWPGCSPSRGNDPLDHAGASTSAGSFVLAALTTSGSHGPTRPSGCGPGSAPDCWGPSPPFRLWCSPSTSSSRAGLHAGWLAYLGLSLLLGLGAAAAGWKTGKALADRAAEPHDHRRAGGRLRRRRCPAAVRRRHLVRHRTPAAPVRHWPWATLLVNVTGSLIIGLSVGITGGWDSAPEWHAGVATGLAGGLTTFSSWTTATVRLVSETRYPRRRR